MVVRFKMQDGDKLGRQFKSRAKKLSEKMIKATQAATYRAADEIERRGRADIKRGGNFGSDRWQDGFRAKVSYLTRSDLNIRVTHEVKYWRVFEYGAVIYGKPMLWIPLDFATDAQGVRARDYPKQLFRVDRAGKAPLLLSDDGPKYFGKEYVAIKPKWHLREIVRKVSYEMPRYYKEAMKNG